MQLQLEKFNKLFSKILVAAFLLSIATTFVFWTFFSNKKSINEKQERAFASVLNQNFKFGDAVLTENDWDLNFLSYLDDSVFPVYLTLKETSGNEIPFIKEDGGRIFILLEDETKCNEILAKLKLKEIRRFKAEKGTVILASDGSVAKPLVFTRDIGKATKVQFFDAKGAYPCQKAAESRWECSKKSWNYVGSIMSVMAGKQQHAVWAHPLQNKTLSITFDLPKEGKTLVFNSAFANSGYTSINKTPVEIELLADGKQLLKYSNQSINKLYSNKVTLPAQAKVLEIRISTKRDAQRHFMFNGYVTDEYQ